MKIPALLIAMALAGGGAFAQSTYSSDKAPAKAPAETQAAPAKAEQTTTTTTTTVHKKKTSAKKKQSAHPKSAAMHHDSHHAAKHHESHHASARHHGTASMGAGVAAPVTDLNAGSRQQRMDQAYADWQARAR